MESPKLLDFSTIGQADIGYLSVAANSQLPFDIKRAYWTYQTPEDVLRGRHMHREAKTVLIALSGTIRIQLESLKKEHSEFVLDSPSKGLYIPPRYWRILSYRDNAVQLCLTSMEFSEADYIRSYEEFRNLQRSFE